MSTQVNKPWYTSYLANWSAKLAGEKPTTEQLVAGDALRAAVKKRGGAESFCIIMALRPAGVSMAQYWHVTKAAGPCLNTVGDNPRNPLKRAKLVTVTQGRVDGKVVYSLTPTPRGQAIIDAVAAAAQPEQPAAKPAGKGAGKRKAGKAGKGAGKPATPASDAAKVNEAAARTEQALQGIADVLTVDNGNAG